MKRKWSDTKRHFFCLLLLAVLVNASGCVWEKERQETEDTQKEVSLSAQEYEERMKTAETTPFSPYPELITYTLGKMTGENNAGMLEGETYEDNAYTRYLREKLNIQNEDAFEADYDEYSTMVSMAIAEGKLPDVMVVDSKEKLEKLMELDYIEDLTDSYELCASDRIKEIYASYGKSIMNPVMVDGKVMAVPETNIDSGPDLLWLRKDWMDALGLAEPKTIEDAEEIIRQFVEKDPGKNGEGNTVGIVCDADFIGNAGYAGEYQLNVLFAAFHAYPKQYFFGKNNSLIYGSVQPEAKKALEYLHMLYEEKVLDPYFLLRTKNNIIHLVTEGKCGSFFGPWWAPNNPLIKAMENNPEAEWMPYLLTDDKGIVSYAGQNPTDKYVVVRKGYEHPEIVWKIISMIFDYERYQEAEPVFSDYYQLNVDPTARPLAINVDYNDSLMLCYRGLQDVLDGKKKEEDLMSLEQAYFLPCREYQENRETASLEDWAAYTSRITACSLFDKAKLKRKEVVYVTITDEMQADWQKLEEMEKETYLKIITGEKDIEYFDTFVEQWKKEGGSKLLRELGKQVITK